MGRKKALQKVMTFCQYDPDTGLIKSFHPDVKIRKAYPYINIVCDGNTFRSQRIAAMLMGCELDDADDVHHVNFRESDNRWKNLQILSRSDHKKLHKNLQDWADRLQVSNCDCRERQRYQCSECYRARERLNWTQKYRTIRSRYAG